MIPEALISALAQAPFVLTMVYVLLRVLAHLKERDQDWQDFIESRDEMFVERLAAMTRSIEGLTNLLITHDALMRGKSGVLARQSFPVGERKAE